MLSKIGWNYIVTESYSPFIRLDSTCNDLEKSGFACTVGADHGYFFSPSQHEGYTGKNLFAAIGFFQPIHIKNYPAGSRCFGQTEIKASSFSGLFQRAV